MWLLQQCAPYLSEPLAALYLPKTGRLTGSVESGRSCPGSKENPTMFYQIIFAAYCAFASCCKSIWQFCTRMVFGQFISNFWCHTVQWLLYNTQGPLDSSCHDMSQVRSVRLPGKLQMSGFADVLMWHLNSVPPKYNLTHLSSGIMC